MNIVIDLILALLQIVTQSGTPQLSTSNWTVINRLGDTSNSELECYQPGNVSVSGGILKITANNVASFSCHDTNMDGSTRNTQAATTYTSGMIQSRLAFTFGDIQVRALSTGAGTWPGLLWMLGAGCQNSNIHSADNIGACNWPSDSSDSAEIDPGEIKTGVQCCTTVYQNICITSGCPVADTTTVTDYTQNWHVYEMQWTSSSVKWFVDGTQTNSSTTHIPQNPMFFMINVAVGGTGGGTPNSSNFAQTLQVDWVKVCSSTCANGTTGAAASNGIF